MGEIKIFGAKIHRCLPIPGSLLSSFPIWLVIHSLGAMHTLLSLNFLHHHVCGDKQAGNARMSNSPIHSLFIHISCVPLCPWHW